MRESGEYSSVFDPRTQDVLHDRAQSGELINRLSLILKNYPVGRVIWDIYNKNFTKEKLSQGEQDMMEVLHGPEARPLGNKVEFPRLMRELGYQAPRGLIVKATLNDEERLAVVKEYYAGSGVENMFCKPLNGTRQRDLVGQTTGLSLESQEFRRYLSALEEDTVIQKKIPISTDIRYIRYRDRKGQNYVAAFQYEEGFSDGDKDFTSRRPERQKARRRIRLPFMGNRINSVSGETLNEMVESMVNMSASSLNNDQHQLSNLNHFLEDAIISLEGKIGVKLPFFSCDIGINNFESLRGEYNFDQLRSNISFIETQGFPHPWAGYNLSDKPALNTCLNMCMLYLREHGASMQSRVRAVLARYK